MPDLVKLNFNERKIYVTNMGYPNGRPTRIVNDAAWLATNANTIAITIARAIAEQKRTENRRPEGYVWFGIDFTYYDEEETIDWIESNIKYGATNGSLKVYAFDPSQQVG